MDELPLIGMELPNGWVIEKYVHSATRGLLDFRRGSLETGRELHQQAEPSAPHEKRARALIYWAREELHAGTDRALELVRKAAQYAV